MTSSLGEIFPNPFSSTVSIEYEVWKPVGRLTLTIYDALGRVVRKFLDERHRTGVYKVFWDGRGDDGENLPPGIYFCRMKTEGVSQTRKIVLAG